MGDLPLSDLLLDNGNQWACYDIVIVGAGPAGLMLAACLARWGYRIKHIDNRAHPTPVGRADGIQPRSLDLLRNMGLKPAIMAHSPARIYETAFWTAGDQGIVRIGTSPSCPDALDARYPFTTLLHQGRIEQVFISDIEQRGLRILRPWTITNFETTFQNPDYPIVVKMAHVDGTACETVHTKYLFSGEGANSFIRKRLKINVSYKEPITSVWAVIDGRVRSDFPDIKMSCSIRSKNGSAMVIPRENDTVRLYVQPSSTSGLKWNSAHRATEEEIQIIGKNILRPYFIAWEHIEWSSTYEIRQGVADRYTLDQRVFLGGDACHVHSPKAGQGMNTAFLDAHNLAWKIHLVEKGFAHREILKTYESERRGVANILIDFDNHYAKLYSQQAPSSRTSCLVLDQDFDGEFSKFYKASRAFVSGYGIKYGGNLLNWSHDHPAKSPCLQAIEGKLAPGHLFITANVTRVVDANLVYLEQAVPPNGSFRIFIFAGSPQRTSTALQDLSNNLSKVGSFFNSHLRTDTKCVSWSEKHNPHSHFFTICIVFAAKRQDIEITKDVPGVLATCRYHVYVDDRQKQAVLEPVPVAHTKAGFDPQNGGIVVVRPDGYVSAVIRLVEGVATAAALNKYFSAISSGRAG